MRTTLIFILVFSIQIIHGQKIDSSTDKNPQELFDYYTYKQKKQKKEAWITLGIGATLTIGGGLLVANDLYGSGGTIGGVMFLIGVPTSLISIPLFISAGKNKKRANLALKGESISFKYIPIEKSNYLALSLTIPIGN